jgi:RNase P subunit RPR2
MPKTTVPGPLDGADFRGRTKSFTALPGGKSWPTCRKCGSTLYPSRRESARARTIGGSRLNVEKYGCRCGRGREVRRPLEAAA